ncbi:MAG: hypothetical protein IJ815_02820 [Lachnospiraceae bacterium]|nr:hypothetical protein [Lachnospiraceae bacterium]
MAFAQTDTIKPVFDSAVSILEVLTEDNQRKVLDFSLGLLKDDEDNPFKPKSEEELFERIDHSIEQANLGMLLDADEVLDEVMVELGV